MRCDARMIVWFALRFARLFLSWGGADESLPVCGELHFNFNSRSLMFSKALNRISICAGRRAICFDVKFAQAFLTRFDKSQESLLFEKEKDVFGRVQSSWHKDFLHSGAHVKIAEETNDLIVLCRTTNFAVVLQDLTSKQIFTVNALSLPVLKNKPKQTDKEAAKKVLLDLFDPSEVSKIEIRQPFDDNGPMVFDDEKRELFKDCDHPYLVISYKKSPNCLVFACTSDLWSPHRAPMKMQVADPKRCGRLALWDKSLMKATVVDLSRMATLPANSLDMHFQLPRSTATDVRAIIFGILQTVMAPTILDGEGPSDEERPEELDTTSYEDQGECTLVIGHYEVDEQNMPLDPTLLLPLKEDSGAVKKTM